MRLRRKEWTDAELASNCGIIKEPCLRKGRWHEFFGNNNPIHVEIGCGKGGFISAMSELYTDINYIGVELQEQIVAIAARKANANKHKPMFIIGKANDLLNIFGNGEIGRIYINFCDPWPRARHAKRRLTYDSFLNIYKQLLLKDGGIHFKTDGQELFNFSLRSFERNGWEVKNVTRDLYGETYLKDNADIVASNIATEYETRFVSQNKPICRCEAFPRD